MSGEVCHLYPDRATAGASRITAEVVGFRDERLILMPFAETHGVRPGTAVFPSGGGFTVPVGEELLGRVIDGLARPIDGKGPLETSRTARITHAPPSPLGRQPIRTPLATGVRALDGFNVANVNTTGFKQSRVTFQDILSQTVRGASGPQAGRGGVNPEQVGLGVLISGIDTIQTQGTLQSTGKLTDMAIQGDGYFVMSDGTQNFFSRDGAFDMGIDGTLVNPSSGLHVMGWNADPVTGVINTQVPPTNITIPIGAGMTGKASTTETITATWTQTTPAVLPPRCR